MRTFTFCLALAIAFAATGPASAQALPPIEHFFDNPEFSAAQLSPSGRYLAARVGGKGARERLAVLDLSDNSARVVANFSDADVRDFNWVNDERLLFNSTDKNVGQGDVRYGPGLYSVNRDGSDFRQLADRSGKAFVVSGTARKILPWHTFMMRQRGAQRSEYVYVQSPRIDGPGEYNNIRLLRLNTLTGHTSLIDRPGDTRAWLLDQDGEPRLTATVADGVTTLQYLDPASKQWRALTSFNTYTGGKGAYTPLAFGPDGALYAVGRSAAQDKSALYRVDLATGKLHDTPLLQLDGYDFSGQLIMDEKRLLGVHYMGEGEDTHWIDPAMKAMQEAIDARLQGTINVVSLPARAETPWVLVKAYSDVQPAMFLLYNRDTQKLSRAGESHALIKPEQMGRLTQVSYKARDGLDIPAWLTLPAGKTKGLPMVVMVHGGPYLRGTRWGWNTNAQFLASRGYAVLEPEFRGSTGYGSKHFRAGWKQWGLAMQDDIADATRWAIAQGVADPKRICIAGASYGGYAALMGLIKDPDLFKCGINWVGVTDIQLMITGHWRFTSDLPEEWKQYGIPELVGDPVKDAAQFTATSPLAQAARITQPLLLAYGGADRRVPLIHGARLRDAVKVGNKDVEWIEYEEEGHGWALPKNRIDFWRRVEKFLDRHIGQH